MRLGVDGWRIHGTTGVSRYILSIAQEWAPGLGSAVFEGVDLLTPRPVEAVRLTAGPGLRERVLRSEARQIVWQNTVLARRAGDVDVLWCPAYVTPLRFDRPVVVTTHDATNAIHPELYPVADRLFYRWFYAWCARHATLVVTNNERTRADIQRHYGVSQDRLRVVPLAPARIFRRVDDRTEVAQVVQRLVGDDRPFFLSVGKVSARRNVPTVVEGFARFHKHAGTAHRLVVVGRGTALDKVNGIVAELGLSEHVTHLEYVTDDELVALYNAAEAFVTAATYEANSLTTIEAQMCGAPVVVPDVPGMREMVDDIAVVMPEVSVVAVAEALSLLATDDGLRKRLSEEGQRHASGFSWSATARGILAVAEEASG